MNLNGDQIQMSAGEREDHDQITISINRMLEELSDTSSIPCICRVTDRIRSTHESAYDPTVVSIGPIHRDKVHLKTMDHQKKRYLKLLLQSQGESSLDRYLKSIIESEEKARKYYPEDQITALGKDGFVQMLLLDGIFVIEFLRECTYGVPLVLQLGQVKSHILRDLLLFENQIPLFILENLLSMMNDYGLKITHLIYPLLPPPPNEDQVEEISLQDDHTKPHHLLGLVHYAEQLGFTPTISNGILENINSATELREAGILFKKSKINNLLDIKFENKKIRMPTLEITDLTESRFRNMIAYEYYLPSNDRKYVTDYTFFLHCLIHAPKDAELLRRYGIISNWLGGDEMVYDLIKGIGANVQTSEIFSYGGVFRDVNIQCRKRKNRWIAVLRRDYFNTPWKLVSLVAGFVLLGVGIVQMVFAILSYYEKK